MLASSSGLEETGEPAVSIGEVLEPVVVFLGTLCFLELPAGVFFDDLESIGALDIDVLCDVFRVTFGVVNALVLLGSAELACQAVSMTSSEILFGICDGCSTLFCGATGDDGSSSVKGDDGMEAEAALLSLLFVCTRSDGVLERSAGETARDGATLPGGAPCGLRRPLIGPSSAVGSAPGPGECSSTSGNGGSTLGTLVSLWSLSPSSALLAKATCGKIAATSSSASSEKESSV